MSARRAGSPLLAVEEFGSGETLVLIHGLATSRQIWSMVIPTLSSHDLRPLLSRVAVPLGAIWGTADRTVPARAARVISDARPDALLTLIDRAGHVPMIERPEEFASALLELLSRLPKDATSSPRRRRNLL